jgi:hypothetical protein
MHRPVEVRASSTRRAHGLSGRSMQRPHPHRLPSLSVAQHAQPRGQHDEHRSREVPGHSGTAATETPPLNAGASCSGATALPRCAGDVAVGVDRARSATHLSLADQAGGFGVRGRGLKGCIRRDRWTDHCWLHQRDDGWRLRTGFPGLLSRGSPSAVSTLPVVATLRGMSFRSSLLLLLLLPPRGD